MPFTAERFGKKLRDLREGHGQSLDDVTRQSGLAHARLADLEDGRSVPSGDEVLILAAVFLCDFRWLVEDDEANPDANLQLLFRLEGGRLTSADRTAISEFLHLCKSQAYLDEVLLVQRRGDGFHYRPSGTYYIGQGQRCAGALRAWHGLPPNGIVPDVFGWLRRHGMRVFRRRLPDSALSGLFIRHPVAGRCILINASEDVYRQRFSAAHEAGHALLDEDRTFNVSEANDDERDYREIRANAFASAFLMPPELLRSLGSASEWTSDQKIIEVAARLMVSVRALLSALRAARLIDEATRARLRDTALRLPAKRDPELDENLSARQLQRKRSLLDAGLHREYVVQCVEAHRQGLITLGKAAEMLLVHPGEVAELVSLFGETLANA